MSPVRPSDVQALLITEDDDWCVIIPRLLKSFYLFWKLVRYMFNASGEITTQDSTAQWGTDICQHTTCATTTTS